MFNFLYNFIKFYGLMPKKKDRKLKKLQNLKDKLSCKKITFEKYKKEYKKQQGEDFLSSPSCKEKKV